VTAAAAPPPPHGHAIDRATVRQKKTGQPVKFEMTEQTLTGGTGSVACDVASSITSLSDSPLEGTGLEPSVPLLRKALMGVANRRRRHERRSHLQVQARDGDACPEWLPIAFPFAEGPRVRIHLPPAESPSLVRIRHSGRHIQPSCRWLVMKASQASRCACSELTSAKAASVIWYMLVEAGS